MSQITTLLALLASVTVVFVMVHARTFPCNQPPLPPPPGRDLQPPFFFPETRFPPTPSMPSPTPPPGRDLPSLQPPFFYPETRSPLPPSMPKPTPPPSRDLPSLQPPFFSPEQSPQFLQPPFFYPETRSPPPPYLEKGHSPPSIGSKFIQKLIIAAGILSAILLLLLARSKCRRLDPETTTQAIGLSAAVMACLGA